MTLIRTVSIAGHQDVTIIMLLNVNINYDLLSHLCEKVDHLQLVSAQQLLIG